MNSRFPILSIFSIVLRVLGWLILAGGVIFSLKQGIALAQCLPKCSVNIPWLLQNIALLVTGCFTIVSGEIIGVVFSIENNIHKLVELQKD
ncbi:MAG: hypothetical protein K8S18_03485 [Desulfobacula sp.]|nr:hypothetical protein [Desulfobacula sp.]